MSTFGTIFLIISSTIIIACYLLIPLRKQLLLVVPWIFISAIHVLWIIGLREENTELKQKQPKPQYEEVTETFYRKIK